ncbi:MAG: hypothetical protein EXR11_13900 [Rhodospirillaceae bacterium]|nr:hypothetical protein [Rhodospirillaceae bacterium]
MISPAPDALAACIDTIEASYEFMLAYAAQGRDDEIAGGAGPSIRQVLTDLRGALHNLPRDVTDSLGRAAAKQATQLTDFTTVITEDARLAGVMVGSVLAVPSISSQLIDNLNASVHVRKLLTDVFLVDEILKSFRCQV